ncbi:type II secretion system protein GspL [Luteimonas sp. JM171]|uniref:type II secretion system protein GspL n=1 Tax=Luteimonas sp. JM171 TaxID=1896164 RepID=UPI000857F4D9|nr:type II secretion system protein GspL [Luteimonas sp. JM171]AOH36402.1 hypothetical protein BGP89_08580 [Luteimonas sp. JM171]
MKPPDPIHVVLLPALAEEPAVRLAVAGDGRVLSRELLGIGSGPSQVPERGPFTVVLVPGTDAPARWLQPTAFSDAQARAAARAQAGEELAAVDAIHVAVGHAAAPAEPRPVVAVAEAAMEDWLARVQALGVRADRMVPDHLALSAPDDPEGWVAVIREGHCLARSARRSFRVEAELAATIIGDATAPIREPETVEALLAKGALAAPLDLLQGPYAAADGRPTGWRAWRRAAVLAGALAVSVPLLWTVEAAGHLLAARKLESDAEARVMKALPGPGADADPVLAARAGLARNRARDDFPIAFRALASGMQELDGAAIERVTWQAGSPLRALVQHSDAAQLDALGNHASSHGLTLVAAGTRRVDGRLHSEVDLIESAP